MAYEAPTIADLKARYPAFDAVDDAIIQYWLDDSARYVDTRWSEADYPVGRILVAAHHMAAMGMGDDAALPKGVTDFRSGTFSASQTGEAANSSGFAATRYGEEYLSLLRRNIGGMRIVRGDAQ